MKKLSHAILLLLALQISYAQTGNVGIGTNNPNSSAILDITSTNKGLLVPRVNLTGTGDITTITSPSLGLLVFNSTAAGSGSTAVEANSFYYYSGTKWIKLQASNVKDWTLEGNAGTSAPATPTTYGSSTFGAGENFIGTTDAQPLTFGTGNIERARFTNDGKLGIGTDAPAANTMITINPYGNTLRNGIYMPYPGSGTISSFGIGINMPVTSNANISGFKYSNSTAGAGVFYGVGADLTGGTLATGYLGYRSSTPKTFAVYGIGGDYSGYFQGKTVITSDNSPTSTSDFEVQNTTAATSPVTFSMRPTTEQNASTDKLASLNFADSRAATQAQIQAIREKTATAGSGSTDLPSALTFSTTPDGSATMAERVRISNNGNIGINQPIPDASAVMDITATDRGLLTPRVALTATNAAGPITSPATGLLVYNTATANTGAAAPPNNVLPGYYYNSGTSGSPVWKRFSTGNNDAWTITGNNNLTPPTDAIGSAITAGNFLGNTDGTDVVFATNNLERMRLNSSGQLTIGNKTAGAKFEVHQTSGTAGVRLYNWGSSNELEFRRSGGTLAAPTATGSGSVVGRMWGMGYETTTSSWKNMANISFEAESGITSTSSAGRIVFSTTPSASTTVAERMRIDNAGQVTVTNLAGTGTRPVYADATGILKTNNKSTTTTNYYTTATAGTSWVVPAGVFTINVLVIGAGGGSGYYCCSSNVGSGGAGGSVMGAIGVTPGETLTIVVGSGGSGSSSQQNGGGGGGSAIKRGATILCAGGGGGGGSYNSSSDWGNPGGVSYGTSINGVAATGGAGNAAGGNNNIDYLYNPISYLGGYGSTGNAYNFIPSAVQYITGPNGGNVMGRGGRGSYGDAGTAGSVYINY